MRGSRELVLEVDPALGRRAGVEDAIRRAIRSGRLVAGQLVPSSRTLARDLGLARSTVVAAYEQLVVEGYLVSRQGARTVVAELGSTLDVATPDATADRFDVDFRPGEPDGSLFPRSAWMRSNRRALAELPDRELGYADPRGLASLRRSLAHYLGRARAVSASPSSISVFGGVMSAIGFVAELLVQRGVVRVGIEDPSLFLMRDVLRLAGLDPVPVPVDREGIDVDRLGRLDVGAVVVTPAHQYPTGAVMSSGRRTALIEWARRHDGWVVEDDYDGEFRYDRQPLGSLQGLDPGRVLYAGTASKSLAPGLRLAWLVVPPPLRSDLAAIKHLRAGVSVTEQATFADFIDRGELDRQVRSARAVYRRRQTDLLARLQAEVPWLEVPAVRAGLHVTATITHEAITEADLVAQAASQSIGLMGLGPHWIGSPTGEGLVLGYSRPPQHGYGHALDRLVGLLAGMG